MINVKLRNKFLERLHNSKGLINFSEKKKRETIDKVVHNVEVARFFDYPDPTGEEDWELVEQAADALFNGGTKKDINEALTNLRESYGAEDDVTYISIDTTSRIRAKRIELAQIPELNIILSNEEKNGNSGTNKEIFIVHYGRNPLHEAVAIRDVKLVKKYAKVQKYHNEVDNNGCTPSEMATYEGFSDAVKILKQKNKKKKRKKA